MTEEDYNEAIADIEWEFSEGILNFKQMVQEIIDLSDNYREQ